MQWKSFFLVDGNRQEKRLKRNARPAGKRPKNGSFKMESFNILLILKGWVG
jgi:hypothetical protein